METTTYTVIVKNGEVVDRGLNYLAPSVRESCGHNHKTYEAAEVCQGKLQTYYCDNCGRNYRQGWPCRNHRADRTSATWYNSMIHAHAPGSMAYLPPSDEEMEYLGSQV